MSTSSVDELPLASLINGLDELRNEHLSLKKLAATLNWRMTRFDKAFVRYEILINSLQQNESDHSVVNQESSSDHVSGVVEEVVRSLSTPTQENGTSVEPSPSPVELVSATIKTEPMETIPDYPESTNEYSAMDHKPENVEMLAVVGEQVAPTPISTSTTPTSWMDVLQQKEQQQLTTEKRSTSAQVADKIKLKPANPKQSTVCTTRIVPSTSKPVVNEHILKPVRKLATSVASPVIGIRSEVASANNNSHYLCAMCPAPTVFRLPEPLRQHYMNVHLVSANKMRYFCLICATSFMSQENLTVHTQREHPVSATTSAQQYQQQQPQQSQKQLQKWLAGRKRRIQSLSDPTRTDWGSVAKEPPSIIRRSDTNQTEKPVESPPRNKGNNNNPNAFASHSTAAINQMKTNKIVEKYIRMPRTSSNNTNVFVKQMSQHPITCELPECNETFDGFKAFQQHLRDDHLPLKPKTKKTKMTIVDDEDKLTDVDTQERGGEEMKE